MGWEDAPLLTEEPQAQNPWEAAPLLETEEVGLNPWEAAPLVDEEKQPSIPYKDQQLNELKQNINQRVDRSIGFPEIELPEEPGEPPEQLVNRYLLRGYDEETARARAGEQILGRKRVETGEAKDYAISRLDMMQGNYGNIPLDELQPGDAITTVSVDGTKSSKVLKTQDEIDELSEREEIQEKRQKLMDDPWMIDIPLIGRTPVKAVLEDIGYKTANLFTIGGAKRVIEEPPLTTLLEENARKVPFSEDNPQMQVSRIFSGIGETAGGLLQIMASLETAGALGFGAAATGAIGFGGLGAVRRIADPDIYRELDPVSFVVGTGLDVMLGAAFPWMSKVGGEVIREPNTIKAFSKFLYQTGVLTTAITATEFGDSLIVELRKNPDKPAMDVLMDMGDQLNWMHFAKTFSMMALLHATGSYTRFMPGKKVGVKGTVEYGKDVKGKFDAEWYESLSGKQKAEVLNKQFEWAQENYQKFTDYNPKTGEYEPIKKPGTIAGAQAVIKREVEWMSRIMRGEKIPIDSMSGAEAPPEAPVRPPKPPVTPEKPVKPVPVEVKPEKPVEVKLEPEAVEEAPKPVKKYIPKNKEIEVDAWLEKGELIGDVDARIDYIEVPTDQRMSGKGKKEVQNIIKWAEDNNASRVVIESERDAIGFWEELGFDIKDQGDKVSTGILYLKEAPVEKPTTIAVKEEQTQKLNLDYNTMLQAQARAQALLDRGELTATQVEAQERSFKVSTKILKDLELEAKTKGIALEEKRTETEAIKEVAGLFKELDPEVDYQVRTDELRTLQDAISDPRDPATAESVALSLQEAGQEFAGVEPVDVKIAGQNYQEIRDGVLVDVVKIHQGADMGTVIHERAETWYRQQEGLGEDFDKLISGERTKYHERTGEPDDPSLSNREWFSNLAVDNAIGAKPVGKIGAALQRIFNKFKEYAQALKKSANRFAKFVKAGKVPSKLKSILERAIEEPIKEPKPKKVKYGTALTPKNPKYELILEKKARTHKELKEIIPANKRVAQKKPKGKPYKHISGEKFSDLDLSKTEAKVTLTDKDIQDVWQIVIKATRLTKDDLPKGMEPHGSAFWNDALSLPDRSRYWYEISAETFNDRFVDNTPEEIQTIFSVSSAASVQATPELQMRRTLSILAENEQGIPVETGLPIPQSVSDALFRYLVGLKTGNFEQTFSYLSGFVEEPPLSTNDRQVASYFNIDPNELASDPRLYELLSRFHIELRDRINAQLEKGQNKYESWQIQADAWIQERVDKGVSTEASDLEEAMDAVLNRLKKADVEVPVNEAGQMVVTKELLNKPKVIDVLTPTTTQLRESKIATVEVGTTQTPEGKRAAKILDRVRDVYDKIVDPRIKKQLDNIRHNYRSIQIRAFKELGRKRTGIPGKPNLIDMIVTAMTGKRATITRIDYGHGVFGTYNGIASPNIRIPMVQKFGDKHIPLTDDQINMVLGFIGKLLKQDAMAASKFKPVDPQTDPDTHSVLIKQYKKLDSETVEDMENQLNRISGKDFSFNVHHVPNGIVIDVNPHFNADFTTEAPERGMLNDVIKETLGDKVNIKYLDNTYEGNYFEHPDYNQLIRRLKNGIAERQKAALRKNTKASGSQSRSAIQGQKPIKEVLKGFSKHDIGRATAGRVKYRADIDYLNRAQTEFEKVISVFAKETDVWNNKSEPIIKRAEQPLPPTYELKKITPEERKLRQKQSGVDDAAKAVETNVEKNNPEIQRAQEEYDIIETEDRIPVLSSIGDAYKAVHKFVWAFGDARREDPQLYDKLMKSFGRRNAGMEIALDAIEKLLPRDISISEAAEISLVYNDTRLLAEKEKTDPEFMEIYRPFEKLLKEYEARAKKDKLFQSDLKTRLLEEIDNELGKYRTKTSAGYKELIRIRDNIKAMQYLPQNIAVQKAIEHKYRNVPKKDRRNFAKSLGSVSAQFKKRTSKLLLKDYIDKGFLEEKDIDIRRLTAEVIDSYYYKSSIKMILDWANQKGMIQPASDALMEKGWYNTGDMGIASPELKDKMVHPLLGSSLMEMGEMRKFGGGGIIKRTLGMSKVGQFIKPTIIWVYDIFQKGYGGMYSLNPISEGKDFLKAWTTVANKTKDYHELNKLNLYQFPHETPVLSKKQAIKFLIRQTDNNIPNLTRKLEKITGMSWDLGDMKLTDPKTWVSGYEKSDVKAVDLLMMPFRVLSNLTWVGDKVIRTQSVLALERMGYTRTEAVNEAARWHGAYSEVSKRYKDTMGYITFVHTFRILMPRQMMRVFYDPIAEGLKYKDSKQRQREGRPETKTNTRYKRMAKSIVFTILLPVLVDTYMKSRGWETEKFGWKWKKKVIDPTTGIPVEIVWAFNSIFNMPLKWYHRLTKTDPIATATKFAPGFERFIKWELHPVYRLIIWDSMNNSKSFGKNERIWMPDDSAVVKAAKWSKYMFLEMFRLYGFIDEKMVPMVAGDKLTTKEVVRQKRIMDDALTGLEQFSMYLFGYPYIRQNLDERRSIKMRQLETAFQQWSNEVTRNYIDIDTGDLTPEGERQLARAAEWFAKTMDWINNDME